MKLLVFIIFATCSIFARDPINEQERQQRLKMFEYEKVISVESKKLLKKKKKYSSYEVKLRILDPISSIERDLSFQYFDPSAAQDLKPIMMIFPPISGVTPLERDIAHYYSSLGYLSVIAVLNEDITDITQPLNKLDNFFIRGISTAQMILDVVSEWDGVDAQRVFSYGASLGGIRGVLFSQVEPRVKATAAFVAGGDLPQVLTQSVQKTVKKYREHRMKVEKIENEEDFLSYLEDVNLLDPVLLADKKMADRFFMVIGTKDTKVPTVTQEKLWVALGEPKNVTRIPLGIGVPGLVIGLLLKRFTNFLVNSR